MPSKKKGNNKNSKGRGKNPRPKDNSPVYAGAAAQTIKSEPKAKPAAKGRGKSPKGPGPKPKPAVPKRQGWGALGGGTKKAPKPEEKDTPLVNEEKEPPISQTPTSSTSEESTSQYETVPETESKEPNEGGFTNYIRRQYPNTVQYILDRKRDSQPLLSLEGHLPFAEVLASTKFKSHLADGAVRDYMVGRLLIDAALATRAALKNKVVVKGASSAFFRFASTTRSNALRKFFVEPLELIRVLDNDPQGVLADRDTTNQGYLTVDGSVDDYITSNVGAVVLVNVYGAELERALVEARNVGICVYWLGHNFIGPCGVTLDGAWVKDPFTGGVTVAPDETSATYYHPDPSDWIFRDCGVPGKKNPRRTPRFFQDSPGPHKYVIFTPSAETLMARGAVPTRQAYQVAPVPDFPHGIRGLISRLLGTPFSCSDAVVHMDVAQSVVQHWAASPVSAAQITSYTHKVAVKMNQDPGFLLLSERFPGFAADVLDNTTRYVAGQRLSRFKTFFGPFFRTTGAQAAASNQTSVAYGRATQGSGYSKWVAPLLAAFASLGLWRYRKKVGSSTFLFPLLVAMALNNWQVACLSHNASKRLLRLRLLLTIYLFKLASAMRRTAQPLTGLSSDVLGTALQFPGDLWASVRVNTAPLVRFSQRAGRAVSGLFFGSPESVSSAIGPSLSGVASFAASPPSGGTLHRTMKVLKWGSVAASTVSTVLNYSMVNKEPTISSTFGLSALFSGVVYLTNPATLSSSRLALVMASLAEESLLCSIGGMTNPIIPLMFTGYEAWMRGMDLPGTMYLAGFHLFVTSAVGNLFGPEVAMVVHALFNLSVVKSRDLRGVAREAWQQFRNFFYDCPWSERIAVWQFPLYVPVGGYYFDPNSPEAFVRAEPVPHFTMPPFFHDVSPSVLDDFDKLLVRQEAGEFERQDPDGSYCFQPTSAPFYRPDSSSPCIKAGAMCARQFAAAPSDAELQARFWRNDPAIKFAIKHLVRWGSFSEIDRETVLPFFLEHIKTRKKSARDRMVSAAATFELEEFDNERQSRLVEPFVKGDEVLMKRDAEGKPQLKPRTIVAVSQETALYVGPYTYEAGLRLKQVLSWSNPKRILLPNGWTLYLTYGTAMDQDEMGAWGSQAIARPSRSISFIGHGDDALTVVVYPDSTVFSFESDFTMFDSTQSTGPLEAELRVEAALGIPLSVAKLMHDQCSAPVHMRVKRADFEMDFARQRDEHPTRNTGSTRTSIGNTIVNTLSVIRTAIVVLAEPDPVAHTLETERAFEASYDSMGFKIKLDVRPGIFGSTFLKGWFLPAVSEAANSVVWAPLPSRIVKFGKVGNSFKSIVKLSPQDAPDIAPLNVAIAAAKGLAFYRYLDPLCVASIKHWLWAEHKRHYDMRDLRPEKLGRWAAVFGVTAVQNGPVYDGNYSNHSDELDLALYSDLLEERYGYTLAEFKDIAMSLFKGATPWDPFRFLVHPIFEDMVMADYA